MPKPREMAIASRTVKIPGDGGVMPAYVAQPKARGKYPVVIVLIEAHGVNAHMKNVTERFARNGYVAICPDLYYRQGTGLVARYEETEKAFGWVRVMYDAQTMIDIRIVIDYAKRMAKADPRRIATTGYCLGGILSWMAACLNRDIKAAAVYYGTLVSPVPTVKRPLSPHLYAETLQAPILAIFGEADAKIPLANVREAEAHVNRLGKVNKFIIYPGAGHGFMAEGRDTYHKASAEDAWKQTLAWFAKHLRA